MRIRYLFLLPELVLLFFFVAPIFKRIINAGISAAHLPAWCSSLPRGSVILCGRRFAGSGRTSPENRHLCGFTGAPCRRALLRCHVSADGSCHLQRPADCTDCCGTGMPCVRHRAKPYAEAPAGSSTGLPQPVSGDGLHRHWRKGLRRRHHRGRGNENVAGGTRHRCLPHSHGGQVHRYAGESPEYRSDSR